MKIIKITNGPLQENCYVLAREDKTAIVIDPGIDKEKILNEIDKEKLNVKYVLLTHGHFDHIYSAKALKDRGAKVFITEVDAPKLLSNELNMGFLYDIYCEPCLPDGFLKEGKLKLDGDEFEIVFTPGHTSGGCSIIYDKNIFTGDTYFCEGVYGRCDLLDGNEELIKKSLIKLKPYLKNRKVLAGHE